MIVYQVSTLIADCRTVALVEFERSTARAVLRIGYCVLRSGTEGVHRVQWTTVDQEFGTDDVERMLVRVDHHVDLPRGVADSTNSFPLFLSSSTLLMSS